MNLSGLNSPPLVAKVSISKNRYPAACGGEVHPRILIEQPEYSYGDPNAGTDTYFHFIFIVRERKQRNWLYRLASSEKILLVDGAIQLY